MQGLVERIDRRARWPPQDSVLALATRVFGNIHVTLFIGKGGPGGRANVATSQGRRIFPRPLDCIFVGDILAPLEPVFPLQAAGEQTGARGVKKSNSSHDGPSARREIGSRWHVRLGPRTPSGSGPRGLFRAIVTHIPPRKLRVHFKSKEWD